MGCAPFLAQDGKTYVVITRGKEDSGTASAKHSFLFDVTEGTWAAGPDITVERQHPKMVNVNGRLLLLGGANLASVEELDPTVSSWTILSDVIFPATMHYFSPIAYNL